jgi:hypothetical protein
MLTIETFDQRQGGNVVYKALAHPVAAEAITRLYAHLRSPVAVVDPSGIAEVLFALSPQRPEIAGLYVSDVRAVGGQRAGLRASPLIGLPADTATVLIAAFDAGRQVERIRRLAPKAEIVTLDEVRLPESMLTVPSRYLDRLNFATNLAFFRDQDGLSTRLVCANYWAKYGARAVRLWLRLFAEDGRALATWEQELPPGPGGFAIDSGEVRRRFNLPAFTGQLFIHAIGAAGHDVVKYALDTYARDTVEAGMGTTLSCTHDANAWPSDRYAGLPAPREDERVIFWLQNSHASPIARGAIALDRMGEERPVPFDLEVGPFATVAVDVGAVLRGVRWPAQVEIRAGRHVVRPRYEVERGGRWRIAHVNVERADLAPDAAIPTLRQEFLGRGYLLPFPVLPTGRFRTIVQPTPMATSQSTLPLRLDVFDQTGAQRGERFLGCLARDHAVAVDIEDLPSGGHAELVYDFRAGGEADGWMHAIFRYEDRESGHAAESSFGSHMFNTLMTYKDEPQSYSGSPPGLTTGLFLKLGDRRRRSFSVLIYPTSAPWHARSSTVLLLHDGSGQVIAEERIAIARSGSATVWPHEVFGDARLEEAGPVGYVLIRDETCRLFGYHGLMDEAGSFSLDHMFGF